MREASDSKLRWQPKHCRQRQGGRHRSFFGSLIHHSFAAKHNLLWQEYGADVETWAPSSVRSFRECREVPTGVQVIFSEDVRDKVHACLNQTWAEGDYLAEKDYYDACITWWDALTPEQQAIGLTVMQAFSVEHPENAEKLAAVLPPAPVCPSSIVDL